MYTKLNKILTKTLNVFWVGTFLYTFLCLKNLYSFNGPGAGPSRDSGFTEYLNFPKEIR